MSTVRPYKESDYDAVTAICRACAPAEFTERERGTDLYELLNLEYYVVFEPENALVAVDDEDRVIGYAAASLHYAFFRKKMVGYVKRRVMQISYGELRRIDDLLKKIKAMKPGLTAHMTFHIAPEALHSGVSTLLLDAMSNHLASCGEPYMTILNVPVTSHRHAFLEQYGFRNYGDPAPDGTAAMLVESQAAEVDETDDED